MLQYACQPFATVDQFFSGRVGCNCTAVEGEDDALVSTCIDMASDALCQLTGGRVAGICTRVVRPIGEGACWYFDGGYWGYGNEFGGQNVIPLRGPSTDIISVVIDGALLPGTAYGLLNDRFLYRVDGEGWPSNNDLTKDTTEVGTWAIRYRFNPPPDKITGDAALELSCALVNNLMPGIQDRLMTGITSLNLQGATATIDDIVDALRNGAEDMVSVARFLGIYAPELNGGRNRAVIWSPEMERGWNLVEAEGPSGS